MADIFLSYTGVNAGGCWSHYIVAFYDVRSFIVGVLNTVDAASNSMRQLLYIRETGI